MQNTGGVFHAAGAQIGQGCQRCCHRIGVKDRANLVGHQNLGLVLRQAGLTLQQRRQIGRVQLIGDQMIIVHRGGHQHRTGSGGKGRLQGGGGGTTDPKAVGAGFQHGLQIDLLPACGQQNRHAGLGAVFQLNAKAGGHTAPLRQHCLHRGGRAAANLLKRHQTAIGGAVAGRLNADAAANHTRLGIHRGDDRGATGQKPLVHRHTALAGQRCILRHRRGRCRGYRQHDHNSRTHGGFGCNTIKR